MRFIFVLFFILLSFFVYADATDDNSIYGMYVNNKFDITLKITSESFTADYISHSDPVVYYYTWLDNCMVCLLADNSLLKVMVVRVRLKLYAFVYEDDQICYILQRVESDKVAKE